MLRRLLLLLTSLACAFAGVLVAPASAAGTSVTITSNKAVYGYNETATFKVKVTTEGTQRLEVEVAYPNGQLQVFDPTTTESETHTIRIAAYTNATVRARVYSYEGADVLATRTAPFRVRAGLSTLTTGYAPVVNGYQVFSRGSSPKFRSFIALVVPAKRCLRHVVQRKYASGWKTVVTSACRAADSRGRVDWRWAGKHASGVKFRVFPTLAADAYNVASKGAPVYFRFR